MDGFRSSFKIQQAVKAFESKNRVDTPILRRKTSHRPDRIVTYSSCSLEPGEDEELEEIFYPFKQATEQKMRIYVTSTTPEKYKQMSIKSNIEEFGIQSLSDGITRVERSVTRQQTFGYMEKNDRKNISTNERTWVQGLRSPSPIQELFPDFENRIKKSSTCLNIGENHVSHNIRKSSTVQQLDQKALRALQAPDNQNKEPKELIKILKSQSKPEDENAMSKRIPILKFDKSRKIERQMSLPSSPAKERRNYFRPQIPIKNERKDSLTERTEKRSLSATRCPTSEDFLFSPEPRKKIHAETEFLAAKNPVPIPRKTMGAKIIPPPIKPNKFTAPRSTNNIDNLNKPKIEISQNGDRDYIGFATLPEQIHRKSVKRGFDFTLMVVGDSGLGKSTLINSLFLSDLYKDRQIPDVSDKLEKTTCIEKKTMDIEERGVKLRLTVVDTPGFGDALNSDNSWKLCVSYIDDQFRQYFTDESGLNRKNIVDNRVHCCLYFIPPYGHGQIDVELMKRLHQKVNIVPVIAKADTLTLPEIKKMKQRILNDIHENNVQIYQFPECDSDEDEEFKQQDKELKALLPFSVIGSNNVIEVGGTRVRGRQYPWGVVEVENPKHSDFNKLRNMLITTHMQDLKDVTEDVHYENFRAQCISQISQQAIRERGKLKRDSVAPMEGFTETDRLLLQKDEEIRRMQDMLAQMQQKLKATSQSNDNIVNI